MKRIVLLSMLITLTVASYGRKHVSADAVLTSDTIYYSADKISVDNRSQASYYRLLLTGEEGNAKRNYFQDYYLDGRLKAEGSYSFIDLANDNNTKLNGEVTTYYENGKEQLHGKYINGLREGYFTLQLKDGSVAVVQYKDGKSLHDYFTVTHPNGNMQKRPLSEIKSLLQ